MNGRQPDRKVFASGEGSTQTITKSLGQVQAGALLNGWLSSVPRESPRPSVRDQDMQRVHVGVLDKVEDRLVLPHGAQQGGSACCEELVSQESGACEHHARVLMCIMLHGGSVLTCCTSLLWISGPSNCGSVGGGIVKVSW